MADPLRIRGVDVPDSELVWRFSRSSGPGGQSVNTSDSRAAVSFDVQRSAGLPSHLRTRAVNRLADRLVDGVLTVTASDQRSQWQNRSAALRRLAMVLTEATRPPPPARRATRPSRGAVERRIRDKKARGQTKRLRRPGGE